MSITLPPLPESPHHGEFNWGEVRAFATAYALAAVELYIASRVPMTEKQIGAAMSSVEEPLGWQRFVGDGDVFRELLMQFVRNIEAHHGIGAKP